MTRQVTVGVDLAAEAKKTGLARIEWSTLGARVLDVQVGATNAQILSAVDGVVKIGIDSPLGWPDAFVDFVQRHRSGTVEPDEGVDIERRTALAFRRTDRVTHDATGLWPLSVSTDRIGRAAMRAAGLLATFQAKGLPIDRSGRTGSVVEVYPAAALRRWDHVHRRYKGSAGLGDLARLVADFIAATADWLTMEANDIAACADSDDAFDAVVAALMARAAIMPGLVAWPTGDDLAVAEREGWIAIPAIVCQLSDLDPR